MFRLQTLQSLHGDLAQLSRNPVLLVFTFLCLNLSLSELQQGLLERYFGISPVLPNKCISYHYIFRWNLKMKWILKNNTNKPLARVFCFVFDLSALLLACPLPLWPPVPSVSFWPLESHPFDFDIPSPFMVVTAGIPLFWNEMVIVIVPSKVGDKKAQCTSPLKSTRQARGLGICRARKPCLPRVQPLTLLSCERSGSFVTEWQVMCDVSPFQRKDLNQAKPANPPSTVI